MRFLDYFTGDQPVISFEIYPPQTQGGMHALKTRIVPNLLKLNPSYMTVTYGAGGSTRAKTLEIASLIQNEFGLTAACHLTCVGSSRTDIDDIFAGDSRRGDSAILSRFAAILRVAKIILCPRKMDLLMAMSLWRIFAVRNRKAMGLGWRLRDIPRNTSKPPIRYGYCQI